MTTITATEARRLLYKPLDELAESHEPVFFALGYHWMPDRRWSPPAHRGAGDGADAAGR